MAVGAPSRRLQDRIFGCDDCDGDAEGMVPPGFGERAARLEHIENLRKMRERQSLEPSVLRRRAMANLFKGQYDAEQASDGEPDDASLDEYDFTLHQTTDGVANATDDAMDDAFDETDCDAATEAEDAALGDGAGSE